MSDEVHFSGTAAEARRIILSFIAALSGDAGQYAPYVRGIKLRVGMVALACIQEAFIDKAAGGAGEDGITWLPLKKETIANRPLGPGDKSLMKGYGAQNGYDKLGRAKRGFLTPAEDKRWRMLFATRKNWLVAKHGMGDEEAAGRAAQIAWATLKAEGAKTKLEVLGNRHVQIGRSSGRLFNSLSPGTTEPLAHPLTQEPPSAPVAEDRILREDPGAVIVGSNVEYAGGFHKLRPLWPNDLPPAWSQRIAEATESGIAEALAKILGDSPGRQVA